MPLLPFSLPGAQSSRPQSLVKSSPQLCLPLTVPTEDNQHEPTPEPDYSPGFLTEGAWMVQLPQDSPYQNSTASSGKAFHAGFEGTEDLSINQ